MTTNERDELDQEDALRDHYDFSRGKRGPVIRTNKVPITIRLDPDILDWFREQVKGGGSYQALINQALRDHVTGVDLNERIRIAIREEIAKFTDAEALLCILELGKRQVAEGRVMPAKQALEQLRQRTKPPDD